MQTSTIGGKPVAILTYTITDGGFLDEDGSANGVIVDPVGLATATLKPPHTGYGGMAGK